jgi:chemotaxis protein CheD
MSPRADDRDGGRDFRELRRERAAPQVQLVLEPGHLLVPARPTAVGAVCASSVVVTIFDPAHGRGGLCHFLRPRPGAGAPATPIFGLPATLALLRELCTGGSAPAALRAGIYGGAAPDWASPAERALALANVAVAETVLARRGVPIVDVDTGGSRGRKLGYLTGTNEIVVVKTDAIRRSDWFPSLGSRGAPP